MNAECIDKAAPFGERDEDLRADVFRWAPSTCKCFKTSDGACGGGDERLEKGFDRTITDSAPEQTFHFCDPLALPIQLWIVFDHPASAAQTLIT
jgi:hypothetical protein